MKKLVCSYILSKNFGTRANEIPKYHIVYQVSRHGNRAPTYIFDHLIEEGFESMNFPREEEREITKTGVKQI